MSADRTNAGLDDESAPNTKTRGAVIASETANTSKGLDNDVDTGVVPDGNKKKLPGLTSGNNNDGDNSNSDDDSVGNEELLEQPTGQRTRSGRVSKAPNRLNPSSSLRMTASTSRTGLH